jgi:acetyl-CoA acyltransferase
MRQAVIAGYARTPFSFAGKGPLKDIRPDDLAAIAIAGLVERSAVPAHLIEDVLVGCAYPEGPQGNNIGRISALLAGLPIAVGGATVNRFCGSSMYAIHIAAGQIALGSGDAFICAGVESMSLVPRGGLSPSFNPRLVRHPTNEDEFLFDAYVTMGETAENVARRYRVSRLEQERFAYLSQMKATSAQSAGRLTGEIVPVKIAGDIIIDRDSCIRSQTTMERLAELEPAFQEGGSVTAGTSSPLTDGASAVLITSSEFALEHGLEVLAKIKSTAVVGVWPEFMGIGPIPATRKALARAEIDISEIDVVELNEAFASQAIACVNELGIDMDRVNIDGGGISIGHPLGATGARITAKAAQILRREGKRYALATQCIGGGQGIATILEAVDI